MKIFRIKKVTDIYGTKYFPQVRILFWWWNAFTDGYDGHYWDGGYDTLEEAQKKLCEFFRYPEVEYIDFDPIEDCKK